MNPIDVLEIVVGSVAYTLMATRISVVCHRRAVLHDDEAGWFPSIVVAIMWPITSVVFGVAVLLTGETGIFGCKQSPADGI